MKKILIIRHAKSDWSMLGQSDFERTLNERGLANAKTMGERLKAKNINPEFFISSSAQRAKQTATIIAEQIGFDINKIDFTPTLYHANQDMIADHIATLDDKYSNAIVVCHNPGITHFINDCIGYITENIPTCGMVQINIHASEWSKFFRAKKELGFYDFPKNMM